MTELAKPSLVSAVAALLVYAFGVKPGDIRTEHVEQARRELADAVRLQDAKIRTLEIELHNIICRIDGAGVERK